MNRLSQPYQRYVQLGLLISLFLLGLSERSHADLFPDGPEFQINTYMPSKQERPAVAMNESGQSVVVWESYAQDGDGDGVFAQRYDSSGAPVGPEFQVNTVTNSPQNNADVAMDDAGNFVVVWQRFHFAANEGGIFGQRYDMNGASMGTEFQISASATADQTNPAVSMDADGDFFVVWHDGSDLDGDDYGIFGRRYGSNGIPDGPQFQVNTFTSSSQMWPDVAMDSVGNGVVVWQSYDQDGSGDGIFGQRYDANGAPMGTEFQVNSWTSFQQEYPAVTFDGSGNFIVVWHSEQQDGDQNGIFGQRFNAVGNPVGGDFQVNSFSTNSQSSPAIDANANGQFTVVWQSWDQDGDDLGVFGQLYNSSGNTIGDEFQVNTFTSDNQREPDVMMDGSGNAVIVWESVQGDGASSYGVFGQRYLPNSAPVCDLAYANPSLLFTNDHNFKIINIDNLSDPDGDSLTVTVNEIYQDEPVNARGSGNTSPDGQGIGTNAAEVRDEYSVFGNGRQYRINFTVEDGNGGSCSDMVFVRAGLKVKFDSDWIIYDSTYDPSPVQEFGLRW